MAHLDKNLANHAVHVKELLYGILHISDFLVMKPCFFIDASVNMVSI
jgi:hypothetical protein